MPLTRTLAPKCRSIFSVWSRVASFSITVVSPGAASPASSTADLSCADGTGGSYSIGIGSRAPCRSAAAGRLRRDLGPRAHLLQRIEHAPHRPRAQRGVAVEGRRDRAAGHRADDQPAAGAGIAEIERRRRLRETRRRRPPEPVQAPSPVRSTRAPSARMALAVLMTSSPSSRPAMRVSPTVSAPRIRARCEIDLSPARGRGLRGPRAAGGQRRGWDGVHGGSMAACRPTTGPHAERY